MNMLFTKDASLSLADLSEELFSINACLAGIESVIRVVANGNDDDHISNSALYMIADIAAGAYTRISNAADLLKDSAKAPAAGAARTANGVTGDQFLAGRDLAVQLVQQIEEARARYTHVCGAQYRDGVPQVTILSQYLPKLRDDPTLVPGFDSIVTDFLMTGDGDSEVYKKLTIADILGERVDLAAI